MEMTAPSALGRRRLLVGSVAYLTIQNYNWSDSLNFEDLHFTE